MAVPLPLPRPPVPSFSCPRFLLPPFPRLSFSRPATPSTAMASTYRSYATIPDVEDPSINGHQPSEQGFYQNAPLTTAESRPGSTSHDDEENTGYLDDAQALLSDEGTSVAAPVRSASFFSSFINLANTIMGSGMLGLPYAISKNGLVLGPILLVVSAFFSAFGLYLLVQCTDRLKQVGEKDTPSYYTCTRHSYPSLAVLVDAVVFVKCIGVAVSFLVIIGSLMPDIITFFFHIDPTSGSIWVSRAFWVLMWGLVIIPTAFLKQLNSLRFTSALALTAIIYLVGLVIVFFIREPHVPSTELDLFRLDTSFFQVMTIYVFGYTCHQNIFSIYLEITNPSKGRINGVIGSSIGTALGVYTLISLLGYIQFGSGIKDNIMNNYPTDNTAVTVGRIFLVILVAFSYALQSHPARICADNLYQSFMRSAMKKEVGSLSQARFYIITISIIAVTFTIGALVEDLSKVLSFVGAIGSTTMCYILPGVFFIKMHGGLFPLNTMKVLSVLAICIGCFVMPTALVFIFYTPPV
ncbi:hypothetical protein H696_01769 [Fonticula alba]|uniref:Amino acid transporter transmembrane domain-containing protein n=1 Tax=Fonticula alba TaxID=691883 RepID=A0A058ZD88_FONAL|nr:hypothetical protein H696_01769 [Fonticula alba]KCV72375.1 hypothetical protein H696_01769 [Fonticula alba]|eukprot:XP_009493953.1 hypothetical protein H696_01769 [Fonticula alba]